MSYKCLYTNGDSWTYGDEIEFGGNNVNNPTLRYYNTWPWFLSKELSIGVCINDGSRGASNYRIFRRTLKFIFDWVESNKNPNELMIVIGWTTPERQEIPITDINSKTSYVKLLLNTSNIYDPKYGNYLLDKVNEYGKLYYELVDIPAMEKMMINHMKVLRIMCNYYGIKYFDFIAVGDDPTEIKNNYENEFNNLFPISFLSKVEFEKWSVYKHNHPTIESHKKWSKELKKFIDEYSI